MYPLGIFILGCGGALLPVRWNRWTVWAAAAGLLAWSLYVGSWMLRWPCPGRTELPVRGMVVEQSTGYTCAPAASATLLAAWGIEKSEHEMAQLCLCVPERGTSPFDVYRGLTLAARASGLRARMVALRRERLGRLVRPFIIGTGAHAIVIFEVREDALLVGDPFVARPVWRPAELILDSWDGVAVLLCRGHPFDGRSAPHLSAWLANAREPRRPTKELR
jgi:ABC-type bacteriocin/lantibiotic exporter with double-glycine peptidase domain